MRKNGTDTHTKGMLRSNATQARPLSAAAAVAADIVSDLINPKRYYGVLLAALLGSFGAAAAPSAVSAESERLREGPRDQSLRLSSEAPSPPRTDAPALRLGPIDPQRPGENIAPMAGHEQERGRLKEIENNQPKALAGGAFFHGVLDFFKNIGLHFTFASFCIVWPIFIIIIIPSLFLFIILHASSDIVSSTKKALSQTPPHPPSNPAQPPDEAQSGRATATQPNHSESGM